MCRALLYHATQCMVCIRLGSSLCPVTCSMPTSTLRGLSCVCAAAAEARALFTNVVFNCIPPQTGGADTTGVVRSGQVQLYVMLLAYPVVLYTPSMVVDSRCQLSMWCCALQSIVCCLACQCSSSCYMQSNLILQGNTNLSFVANMWHVAAISMIRCGGCSCIGIKWCC